MEERRDARPPRVALLVDGPAPALLTCARHVLHAVAGAELAPARADDLPGLARCDAVLAERPMPGLARQLGHDAAVLAARVIPPLVRASPLRERRVARTDLLLAFPLPTAAAEEPAAVARAVRLAFSAAEERAGRLAVVERDAAAPGPWAETVARLAAEHPDVELERLPPADAAAGLVGDPARFDVLACDAAAGELLAGVASALTGIAPLASQGSIGPRAPALFTPFRAAGGGSTANPLPTVLAAALLLRVGLGMEAEAARVDVAIEAALETGLRTPDLLLGEVGERRAGTEALAAAVVANLEQG
jgi:3-isopropylmalate dehydrogenase